LVKGEIIPKVVLTAVRVLKDTLVPVLELELTNVVVSSLQESDSAGGDLVPTESVSFHYEKIKLTYTAADGTKTSTEWSVTTAK
jgi:type VI protein secretion system component Hcp